ncbi:unnamed protein product [Linum tenue]|uniref:Uncharacterized protein n=1 Tax=Linum tenue TaxID=586396 RepID=A0AAV0NL18_9ROSI|nr:unnamed protein product [Linum tenue]
MLVAIGLFVAIVALVALCAHQPAKEKQNCNTTSDRTTSKKAPHRKNSKDLSASSRRRDGSGGGGGGGCEKKGKIGAKVATGGFGEGGLWQKSILRGEKCQLPEFSGVIFYDSRGNQIQIAE